MLISSRRASRPASPRYAATSFAQDKLSSELPIRAMGRVEYDFSQCASTPDICCRCWRMPYDMLRKSTLSFVFVFVSMRHQ
eukprot:scaffold13094_cov70-Phaeocystis_antarctica.AAC.4